MKNKLLSYIFVSLILTGCVGVGSKGLFGTGVSVALDPRTVGTQIDDSIMQKSISAKILAKDKQLLFYEWHVEKASENNCNDCWFTSAVSMPIDQGNTI